MRRSTIFETEKQNQDLIDLALELVKREIERNLLRLPSVYSESRPRTYPNSRLELNLEPAETESNPRENRSRNGKQNLDLATLTAEVCNRLGIDPQKVESLSLSPEQRQKLRRQGIL